MATFVSSIEFGTKNTSSVNARIEPKRILPVPCVVIVRSRLASGESLASHLSVLPTFCRLSLAFPIAKLTCP